MGIEVIYSNRDKVDIAGNQVRIDLFTIDGSRAPTKSLSLLFDTGAFICLVNKDTAETNGYKIVAEKSCTISGFSEKGMLCDLRIIPTAIFCGFRIDDVLVATPHADGISVSEVLGMNVLENFAFGLDMSSREIYANKRDGFVSQKPRYQSGAVGVFAGGLS